MRRSFHIINDVAETAGSHSSSISDERGFTGLFREAAIAPEAAGAPQIGPTRLGSMSEDPERAAMDSIVIALLEDSARDRHVGNNRDVMRRASPLDREELYWNVCGEELDAQDITRGTCFPAVLESAGLPPGNQKSVTAEPETRGSIVIAEDDDVTRMLLCRVLTRAGFVVLACENGQLACDVVRREGADVVLLDWVMPVMDGPTAVANLKANLDTRGIPVVMLTTRSGMEARVDAFKTGVQDFLTKPCDTRELIARIEQQMRWRKTLAVDFEYRLRP